MKKLFALFFAAAVSGTLSAVPVDVLHGDFARFSRGKSFIGTGNQIVCTGTSEGWLLEFPKAGRTERLNLLHNNWKRPRTEQAVLRFKFVKGSFAIRLSAVDAKGRWFTTNWEKVDENTSRVVFSLKKMPNVGPWCRLMYISIDAAAPGSQMFLQRIDVVAERSEEDILQLYPDTKERLIAAYEKTPSFVIRNGSAKHITKKAVFTLKGMAGKEWVISKDVDLPPYSECRFTPDNPPPGIGTYYGQERRDSQRLMVAYVPYNGLKTPGNKEFVFAMDNHWINPSVIEGLDYLGVRSIRTIVGWERIQPAENKWEFKDFDARISALEKAGVKMRETLVFTPPWAATSNPRKLTYPRMQKPKLEAWKKYVRTMFERYGDRVDFFELWNEPDLTGFWTAPVEDYIAYCREARKIAKEVNPNIKLASGGMATLHPTLWEGIAARFHEAVLRDGSDTFDIHSYHEHGYFPHYQKMVDQYFLPLREKYNITQPWLASETAMHSAKGTDILQADCLFKKLLFTWARGGYSYTWYGLCNNGLDLDYSEDNFGIFDQHMNPKYIFAVYAALVANYQTASFQKQLESKEDWFFAFRTPQDVLVANWKSSSFGSNKIYAAKSSADAAMLIDLDGNKTQLDIKDQIVLFPVENIGSSLLLKNTQEVEKVFAAAELKVPPAVILGQATRCSIRIANPWNKPVKCTVTPVAAPGMTFSGLPAAKTLSSNDGMEFPFTLTAKQGSNNVTVHVQFDGGEKMVLTAPVNFAILAPNANFNDRKPDFALTQFQQVEHNFVFDPESAKKMWKNAQDLSAGVYIGRSGNNLLVRAVVKDDIHFQDRTDGMLWNGDSVQIALEFPGQSGHFEFGGGITNDGKIATAAWLIPARFDLNAFQKSIKLNIVRQNGLLYYDFSVPLKAMKVNAAHLAHGFKFNLLVNDNDDKVARKCFIRIAQGIGSNQSMKASPLVICR